MAQTNMTMLGIQVFGLLFGLFMIYISFLHFKRKEFTVKEGGFWLLLWIVFIVLIMFPVILDPVVRTLQLYRRMDLFIILGFIFLTGAVFYTYLIVRKDQNRIEKLVREVALQKRCKDEKRENT
jgi:hypothetical protein